MARLIVHNAKIATLNQAHPLASALAVGQDGNFIYVGEDTPALWAHKGPNTQIIDLEGRRILPGLNDSHLHILREALWYNGELRWDGVTSLKRGLEMLTEQAKRTPEGQWVRVVGGWTHYQFEEKRQPTLEEINAATGSVPCFILCLYGLAFLNKAGIAALNYTKATQYPGGEVQVDASGVPTGILLAKPSAMIFTLALLPRISPEEQENSTMQFYREMNRLGLTSAIDPGGGGQAFPAHYEISMRFARAGKLTIRTAYYLFAQEKGKEHEDYSRWIKTISPGANEDPTKGHGFCLCGAGENVLASAADFENFLEPRPELPGHMDEELEKLVELFVSNRWPFRIHATYNESIGRMLTVFEKVNKRVPFNGLRWFFDHAETITDENLDRVHALGGGIAVQNRMFFQGESFVARYGADAAKAAPPIKKMLAKKIPVGFGTDGTRVSSFNPWLSLYWIVSGKTWGGAEIHPPSSRLSREEAFHLYSKGSAWFSSEEAVKGEIAVGQYGDFIVPSVDFLHCPEDAIRNIQSHLTVVDGKVVYAADKFASLGAAAPAVIPSWSPVAVYGGYQHM